MKIKSLFVAVLALALAAGASHARAQSAPDAAPGETAPYGTPYAEMPAPQDVVIYQVNLRAFSAAGNQAGVQARLDEIKALGANVLYLLPIYPVGIVKTVHSPYCVRDYLSVDEEYGTLADLRTLVEEAHKRKLAVLLDWVANHTAWDHPWIDHKDWYKQDAAGNIISPPNTGWLDVAALSYDSQEMRAAMIDAMRYWVRAANVDGYRCDAADFMPFDFWQQAITSLRASTPRKLLLFAEGKRPDHYTAGFDLKYGMAFYSNLSNRIFGTHQAVSSIDVLNTTEYREAQGDAQVVRYTSNHDVDQSEGAPAAVFNGRQGSLAAFVAAAYMKGVPMIYDGQEVGCPVKLSFFDRTTPIDWSLNPDLTAEYQRILGLRNRSAALRRGELHSYSDDDVCAFSKVSSSEEVLVIDNLRATPSAFTVPDALTGKTWQDAYTGADADLPGRVDLEPYQYRVYKRK